MRATPPWPDDMRKHPRRRASLTVRVACVDSDRAPGSTGGSFRVFSARTSDVSDAGLAISASEEIASGRRVILELELPDGRSIPLQGRIVWLEPRSARDDLARMGIEFADLSLGLSDIATRSPS